jgi:anti-anti-sigma factor
MIETTTCADGSVRLLAHGELSGITAVSLRHLVADSIDQGVMLIIDLLRVDRIDADGVSALVGTVRRARSVGTQAQVINAQPEVKATFELAGVYDMLLGSITADDTA